MSDLWYVGALVSIVGSVCSNLGVNCQKYSFLQNAKLDVHRQRQYLCQPIWRFGTFLVFFGSIGDFVALSLAAQSIVAPIGSVTLVANLFFASIWLKERLSTRDVIGTVLIIGGCTLSVAFGDHSDSKYSLSDLQLYFSGMSFIIYAVLSGTFCLVMYLILKLKIEPLRHELERLLRALDDFPDPNVEEAQVITTKLMAVESRYAKLVRLHPFIYCALSGILGAQSILFGKMVSELVRSSIEGDNQMIYALTYVFLFSMLFFVATQLHFLARGLVLFDALYVVPLFQSFFITVSTVGGACYFLEFSNFTVLQIILFPIGIITTISGVVLLSSRKMQKGARTTRRSRAGTFRPILHQKRKKSHSPAVSEANSVNQGMAANLGWTVDLQSPRGTVRPAKKSGDLIGGSFYHQIREDEEEDGKRPGSATGMNDEETSEQSLASDSFTKMARSPAVQSIIEVATTREIAFDRNHLQVQERKDEDEQQDLERDAHRQVPPSASELSFVMPMPSSSSSVASRHEAIALTMPLSASFPPSNGPSPALGPQRSHTTLNEHLLRASRAFEEEEEEDNDDEVDVTSEVPLPGLQVFSHALTAAGSEIVAIGASALGLIPGRRRSIIGTLTGALSGVLSYQSAPDAAPATTSAATAEPPHGAATAAAAGRHVTYRVEVTREDGNTEPHLHSPQPLAPHENRRYGAMS